MLGELDVGWTQVVLETSLAELFVAGHAGDALVVGLAAPPAHGGAGCPVSSAVAVVASLT